MIEPFTSDRNRKPNSPALGSPESTRAGVVEIFHTLQGQEGAALVVNDHITVEVIGVPEISLTPLVPPLTTAVYVVEKPSGALGCSVAAKLPVLYVTDDGTTAFDGSSS
jgi:hypothetical protein